MEVSEAEGLAPEPGPIPAPLSRSVLVQRLRRSANDRLAGVCLIGYDQAAAEMVAADPWLRAKQGVWIVKPEEVHHLCADLRRCGLERIQLAWTSQAQGVSQLLAKLPLLGSLAVIDTEWCAPAQLMRWVQYRFSRFQLPLWRQLMDWRHLRQRWPELSGAVTADALAGACPGGLAIAVAAGPSLDRRIDWIRAHMDHAVIIACDVVYGRLMAAGVRVDLVVNVDSELTDWSRLPKSTQPDAVLVMPYNGHPAMAERFERRVYFGNDPLSMRLYGRWIGFPTGTTVGIATVGLAMHLGCAEIVLAGHDLCLGVDGSYYSSLVHDHVVLATLQGANTVTVPGNLGRPVPSNPPFEVALQDLAFLIAAHPEARIANLNLLDGLGAEISGAVPPSGFTGPSAEPRMTLRTVQPPSSGAVEKVLLDSLQATAALIHERFDQGRDAVEVQLDLVRLRIDEPCLPFLRAALLGPAMLQLALAATPASLSSSGHSEAIRAHARHLLDQTVAALQVKLEDREPSAQQPTDARVIACLRSPVLVREVDGEVNPALLMRNLAAGYLQQLGRDLGIILVLPPPRTYVEGLGLAWDLRHHCPPEYLALCLALAGLADEPLLRERAAWARSVELVPTGPPAEAIASASRLGAGGEATFAIQDLRCALAWPPTRLPAVEAALKHTPGQHALIAMVKDGVLPLDDQICSLLIHHLPDASVIAVDIDRVRNQLGDASTVALAHLMLRRGRIDEALGYARPIRQLSRLADEASAIVVEAALVCGLLGEAQQRAAGICDPKLQRHWLARCAMKKGDLPLAVEVAVSGGDVDVPLLASILGSAWQRQDRNGILAVATAARLHPPAAELAPSAERLLQLLPAGDRKPQSN